MEKLDDLLIAKAWALLSVYLRNQLWGHDWGNNFKLPRQTNTIGLAGEIDPSPFPPTGRHESDLSHRFDFYARSHGHSRLRNGKRKLVLSLGRDDLDTNMVKRSC
ncbi:unnamed protein product [Linum trigynum]|uniref:Uncharacterized protein n=1 Tax=Linum trigynum TaxID=586398 RepID=A0AAV2ES86_9ROSI